MWQDKKAWNSGDCLCLCTQGGTCLFIGDDHKLIDETAALAQEVLTCKVVTRKKHSKESGFFQVYLSALT